MKARLILISIALAFCFPAVAYADLYNELDGNYDGDFWSFYINADASSGANPDTGVGNLSVNLVLSDIFAHNADLARIGSSPAGQAALQITQLDFIRGAYGRLTQLYNLQTQSFLPALNELRRNTANLNNMYDYVTEISSTALGINTNLTVVNQRLNTLISGQSSQSQDLVLINENANGIYTTLSRFLDVSTANQYALGNQLRSYFHPDPNGDGSGAGYIYALLNDIDEYLPTIVNRLSSLDTRLGNVSTSLGNFQSANHSDFENVISAINALDVSVDYPGSISIDNWPQWPSFLPIIDAINAVKTILENELPVQLPDFPSLQPVVDAINNVKNILDDWSVYHSGNRFLRVWIWNQQNDGINNSVWISIRGLQQNFSELFDYLTNQDGILKQIRDLLTVSNPDTVIGDFDGEQFDANVDDLTARLATVAPFGALLMVSAELDIMQSVTAVQQPEFNIPFNFFGTSTVNIDLGFMNDARPLFNFIVVFGFVYMLLIYTIDFVKEGEL